MHALCLSLLLFAADAPARWPGFLGANATPPVADAIPLEWSPEKNIAWKADLPGDGQSSPVVWGEQVFVTSIEGPKKEKCHVIALALADGKHLWTHTFDSSDPVANSLYVSRAAPTPVVDAARVYAFFESGDVVALGHAGKPQWSRSLSADYGKFKNKFGLAASPVQTADAIIILVDDEGPSYLIALSKSDGKVLWKTDRTSRTSWSSPSLLTSGEKQYVVCSSAGSVDGYDPVTGKLLWSYDEVGGNTAATPLEFGGGQFLVGAAAGREAGDRAEDAKKSNFAMTIEVVDGQPKPKVVWMTTQASPSFGSPIVHAGHAYWVNRSGVVYCYDAATGESRYTQRTKQSCWATPLGIGDRVYFFGKDGVTTVLAAGPKFEVLAENTLWNPEDFKPDPAKLAQEDTEEKRNAAAQFATPVQYGVAAVGNRLLIRSGGKLFCVGQK